MAEMHWLKRLKCLDACGSAIEWAKDYPDLAAAWQDCERGDWMLWLIAKYAGRPGGKRRRLLVLAACECARLSLHHVPAREERPLKTIEIAERWARQEAGVSLMNVRAAAAFAAAAGGAAAFAADSAGAVAAGAAAAAAAAAFAADAADAVADAAGAAASAASAAAGGKKSLKKWADIVRGPYPQPPIKGPDILDSSSGEHAQCL